jgi:sterol desaturase/sphingolipid hydroxylase (fatty acid hydroxylase superfamily)
MRRKRDAWLGALAIGLAAAAVFVARHRLQSLPHSVLRVPADKVAALVILSVLFIPLERLLPLHREQRVLRRGWQGDVLYFWFNSFFATAGTIVVILLVGSWMRAIVPGTVHHAIRSQPLPVQFVEAFFLSEVAEYWAHRTMHTVPWLWKFHAVHHGVDEMDWLASARLHPIDRAFTRSSAFLPLFVFGFSTVTVGAFTAFAALQALAVHANVRIHFRPLSYVLATPHFHHWHHAAEVVDKNFAAQLPVVDWMFGSLYVPREWPEGYGLEGDPIPVPYLQQLAWPFRRNAKVIDLPAIEAAEAAQRQSPDSTAASKPGKRASRSLRRSA